MVRDLFISLNVSCDNFAHIALSVQDEEGNKILSVDLTSRTEKRGIEKKARRPMRV